MSVVGLRRLRIVFQLGRDVFRDIPSQLYTNTGWLPAISR